MVKDPHETLKISCHILSWLLCARRMHEQLIYTCNHDNSRTDNINNNNNNNNNNDNDNDNHRTDHDNHRTDHDNQAESSQFLQPKDNQHCCSEDHEILCRDPRGRESPHESRRD